jgi:hypothetical protein
LEKRDPDCDGSGDERQAGDKAEVDLGHSSLPPFDQAQVCTDQAAVSILAARPGLASCTNLVAPQIEWVISRGDGHDVVERIVAANYEGKGDPRSDDGRYSRPAWGRAHRRRTRRSAQDSLPPARPVDAQVHPGGGSRVDRAVDRGGCGYLTVLARADGAVSWRVGARRSPILIRKVLSSTAHDGAPWLLWLGHGSVTSDEGVPGWSPGVGFGSAKDG